MFLSPCPTTKQPFIPERTDITNPTTCLVENGEKDKDHGKGDPHDIDIDITSIGQLVNMGVSLDDIEGRWRGAGGHC